MDSGHPQDNRPQLSQCHKETVEGVHQKATDVTSFCNMIVCGNLG